MASDNDAQVAVSRRIAAPASDIFGLLADPKRHVDLDGSGMVRGSATDDVVSRVGDVFVMKMYYSKLGDYEMNNHVVEFEVNRRITWEPAPGRGHPDEDLADGRWGQTWTFDLVPDGPDATIVTEIYDCSRVPEPDRTSMDNGRMWIDSMTETLQRLDQLCTGNPGERSGRGRGDR